MISKSPSIPVGIPKKIYNTLCFCKDKLVKLQPIFDSGCKRTAELSTRHHLPSEGSPLWNTEKFWRRKKSCHRFVWPDDGKNHRDENRTSQWSGQVHLSVFDDSHVVFTRTYFKSSYKVGFKCNIHVFRIEKCLIAIHVDG